MTEMAPDDATGRRILQLVTWISMALLLVVAVVSFLPRTRVWGLNHLAFYPIWLRVAVLLAVAVTFWPGVGRWFYRAATRVADWLADLKPLFLVVLVLVMALPFFVFPVATDLWGDGLLLKRGVSDMIDKLDPGYAEGASTILSEERVYPGAMLMYFIAARLGVDLLGRPPAWGFGLLSSLLGGLLLAYLVGLPGRVLLRSDLRAWLVVLILCAPMLVLFFGYAEFYTPLVFFLGLYVVASFRALHERGSLWLPTAWLVVAIIIHVQAILFVPSLLFLMAWRRADARRPAIESRLPTLLIALTALAVVAAWLFLPLGDFYIPLRSTAQMYGLFAPAHLLDIVNELLLLLPALPVLLGLAWFGRRRRANDSDSASGFGTNRDWRFVYLILFPCVVYLCLFRPDLGMARDWDLFAMLSLGLIPWAVLVAGRLLRAHPGASSRLSPAVAITVALFFAWIGIHASWARSVDRFEAILSYDKLDAAYVYGNLARVYHDDGQLQRAIEHMESSVAADGRPWHHIRLAKYYTESGDVDRAVAVMQTALKRWPEDAGVRLELLRPLAVFGAYAEMLERAAEGTRLHPENHLFWYYKGEVLVMLDRGEEARQAYERALVHDPPELVRRRIAMQLRFISDSLSASP